MATKKEIYKNVMAEITNAPKSHYELCKIAKSKISKMPKTKFMMDVFLKSNNKLFCTLEGSTKIKLKKSKEIFSLNNNDRPVYFGEIKPINR